jgi:hypothetical protein
MQAVKWWLRLMVTALAYLICAYAQRYEITPLVGGISGGTVKLEQQGVSPNVEAHIDDSFAFGVSGGFRFDSDDLAGDVCERCDSIDFRWLRQNTHMSIRTDPLAPQPVIAAAFYPSVTIDRFLTDFTHSWNIHEAKAIKPFVTASLGAARLATPESSAFRFVFGIGTGVDILPKPRWGIRFQVEYLPIVMHAELQSAVCAAGCVFVLGGGLMNQFEFSVGPTIRF